MACIVETTGQAEMATMTTNNRSSNTKFLLVSVARNSLLRSRKPGAKTGRDNWRELPADRTSLTGA